MRLLDLFCGAGGAAVGYHRAGFTEIVGVDHRPQPRYPFEFVQADAMTYPLEGFDAIHASSPCHAYIQRNKNLVTKHPKLIAPTRARLRDWGGVYVIENVLPDWGEAMGIDWMDRYELSQAIPPAYTEYIGQHLLKALEVPA